MINGQALGDVAKERYGLFRMSWNGCEVIAVCNALTYLGIPHKLRDVSRYMARYSMLLGFFGCDPFRIGSALRHFGVGSVRTKSVGSAEVFILSSWTGRPFMSTIHTVFCVRENNRIKVYNRYNKCPTAVYYSSVGEIFKGCRTISAYIIIDN